MCGRKRQGKPPRVAYRTDEVAAMLGLPVYQVRKLLRSGELPGVRIGGSWFVTREKLDEILRGGLAYAEQVASLLIPAAIWGYEAIQRAVPWLDRLLPG
ncbi:MAG TPA: helix-turn-helix domain-containing protein [Thermomicrobiales bacterium]|nr:helix-turn-helix domain-containing protein [Thermomicrobiales bacterium]